MSPVRGATRPPSCPACRVEMEQGFVLDRGHGNYRRQSTWIAGAAERQFLRGVKVKDRDQRKLLAFRCPDCGLVLHYAP